MPQGKITNLRELSFRFVDDATSSFVGAFVDDVIRNFHELATDASKDSQVGASPRATLNKLLLAADASHKALAAITQELLYQFGKFDFPNLEQKAEFAKGLQAFLTSIRHKVRCPKCEMPGNLRFSVSLKYPEGVFDIDHKLPKQRRQTHRIGSRIDRLVVVTYDNAVVPQKVVVDRGTPNPARNMSHASEND